MKAIQVNWARQHDWYITDDSIIEGHYRVWVRDAASECGARMFLNFSSLKAWAGY